MSDQLSIEELYQRFDTLLPGEQAVDSVISTPESTLFFERVSMDGLDEMHSYSTDERLYQYFEFEPFKTIEDTRAYIDKLQARMTGNKLERTAFYWFVRRKNDDRLIGTAALVNLNVGRQSIEWGYGVDPELWGKGYILDLQEMLKHYVFDVLKLNRLYGVTMVENEPTIASVSAAGFKHEGTLRQYYNRFGAYHDGWAYSMLVTDYLQQNKNNDVIVDSLNPERLIEIAENALGVSGITIDSDMHNCPEWDSVMHVSLIVSLNTELGVDVGPSDMYKLTSIRSILDYISVMS